MSKTYEYIPTLSITPDTQEHRMSAARFIPAILGRRRLIAYYAVESRKEEGLCKEEPPVRALTTAQKQRGMTLEQTDAQRTVKRADHVVCRRFSIGEDGVNVNFLADVYIEMLDALSSANSVQNNGIKFKERAHIWLQSSGEASFKLDLSPLKFESDGHHLQGVSDTLRNSSVKTFTAHGHLRSDAEQMEWDERSLRANAARDRIISNARGALNSFRTSYDKHTHTMTVPEPTEQMILRALSKKSEIAERITQDSWSKGVPENMSNVLVSLTSKKTSDAPLKVEMLKKRRVDDFDNTIGKSAKFTGVPVGFRIYNKDQELVAFHDHRIRDNVPNANGLWFPVAGVKRDITVSEVTPENTPRWTTAERNAMLSQAIIKACTESMAASLRAMREGEMTEYLSEMKKRGLYVSPRGMAQALGLGPAFDAEGYYNL